MNWRLRKLLVNGSHLLLALTIILTVFGFFPGGRALGFVVCGGASIGLLLLQVRRLLRGYYDRMIRMEVYIPSAVGLALGLLALVLAPTQTIAFAAVCEIVFWLGMLVRYWLNGKRFITKGDGLLPWASWLNVPAEAIREGDVLLMSGRISKMTKNSVGHVELVVRKDGKLVTITAYIANGIVLFKTVRSLCKVQVAQGGHYIVIRPKGGFTQQQNDRCIAFAEKMLAANQKKTEQCKPKMEARWARWLPEWLCNLPVLNSFLPRWKETLATMFAPTGYDHVSMRIGTHKEGLWTCHWIVLKTLEDAGVPVEEHESGFLGLGTGLLNPPYPVSLMADQHFRLLTLSDKLQFDTACVAGQ